MCGIAGIAHLDGSPVSPDTIRAMCDLIRHRGPDDAAVWTGDAAGLGQRRLSIIDLSPRGRNPMPNEDESLFLVANGEIYNYRELKAPLLEAGHRFRSDTDTEVLLHSYEERGTDAILPLNGMFAFALWDRKQRRLVLARDRFGVKPLYYTTIGNTFAFASEIKAFRGIPEFRAKADPIGLAEHFTFQNTFGERTLFEGVHLLEAGHLLVLENGAIHKHRYWDLAYEPEGGRTLQQWAHGLRERFEQAVQRQLMSDVPLGTYLSGGMDTGAISAVSSQNISQLHTFTCGFDIPEDATDLEQFFDERAESHRLSRVLRTIHHELEMGPDAMSAVLPQVVWHLDEPRAGISYQVYLTAEMIRQHVTVVLSGVGGDELFAGYPWKYGPAIDDDALYRQAIRFLTDSEKRGFFSKAIDYSTRDSFDNVMAHAVADGPLHRALYFDFKTFLNALLIVDDKLAMAHSLEARVPFLDNDLVDYARRIPADLKLRDGEGKLVLREAMRGLLPDETIFRRKQGFTPPDETWYRGHSLPHVRDLILGERALDRGYFRAEALQQILDEHVNGRKNHRFLLWSLMCFEWWNRLFVDR